MGNSKAYLKRKRTNKKKKKKEMLAQKFPDFKCFICMQKCFQFNFEKKNIQSKILSCPHCNQKTTFHSACFFLWSISKWKETGLSSCIVCRNNITQLFDGKKMVPWTKPDNIKVTGKDFDGEILNTNEHEIDWEEDDVFNVELIISENKKKKTYLVQWEGFIEQTNEPCWKIEEDVPELVKKYHSQINQYLQKYCPS